MSDKTILEQWRTIAYDQQADRNKLQQFWANYFNIEKGIYEQLLSNPDEVVSGTVKELAEKYGQSVLTMVGFLDGINDSLKIPNPIETMDEDTQVTLAFDKELLYKNMVDAKADWLYELPQWNAIFTEEKRKELYKEQKKSGTIVKPHKIGRNDPCPCGSGKKYKFCCMNKAKSPVDEIESVQERMRCLKSYPYVGENKEEGRIYLDDYFDRESIEIDKLLYLGLIHRPVLIWLCDEVMEEERCRKYLTLAFEKFEEKVQKEEIKTFQEYDKKYGIHYFCGEWTEKLAYLLKKNKEKELYQRVERCRKQMM